MSKFRDFLRQEMGKRGMSGRNFAEFVGVNPTTIHNYAKDEGNADPSMDFLSKLAKATGYDLIAIVALAYPEVYALTRPEPEAIIFAQRLSALPADQREVLYRMILK